MLGLRTTKFRVHLLTNRVQNSVIKSKNVYTHKNNGTKLHIFLQIFPPARLYFIYTYFYSITFQQVHTRNRKRSFKCHPFLKSFRITIFSIGGMPVGAWQFIVLINYTYYVSHCAGYLAEKWTCTHDSMSNFVMLTRHTAKQYISIFFQYLCHFEIC